MYWKDTALVIIDIQNDYFEGGMNPLYKAESALNNAKKVIELCRNNHLPVVHVQHISQKENASFFIKGTKGANIHAEIVPQQNETVVIKHYANSFYETNLDESLKQHDIKKIVIIGMMTHHCIDTTVRAARDYDYEVTVVQEACATKDLEINEQIIPAETVQKTFMAALQGFAHVIEIDKFLENIE